MTAPEGGGPAQGSIILRKTGPLPNWVWMSLLLLVALVYSMWRRNRAAAQAATDEGPEVEEEPGDQSAPPVFILPQNPQPTVPINITIPAPARPPLAPVKTVPATPRPAPPIGARPAPPTSPPRAPAPPAKPGMVTYVPVKVVKYADPPGPAGPPWNSTLWGIAKYHGYGSAGNNYLPIWNDPKNAALKKKRGQPVRIQPGDVVYVRRR